MKLIKKQVGFRPGHACTEQILIFVQVIENEYENCLITGAAFIDLTAAYDTVKGY